MLGLQASTQTLAADGSEHSAGHVTELCVINGLLSQWARSNLGTIH
jgi:hypothetical protein